jgi:hypothetical protein
MTQGESPLSNNEWLRGYQTQTESSYEKMHHHDNLKNLGCRIMEVK